MKIISAFILALVLSACSTIHYASLGKGTVNLADRINLTDTFQVEGDRVFYLWGLYPREHVVWVDQEIYGKTNIVRPGAIKIEEYQTWRNALISVATLGMYVPRNWRLSGKGIKADRK
jgi:hypothetical protein